MKKLMCKKNVLLSFGFLSVMQSAYAADGAEGGSGLVLMIVIGVLLCSLVSYFLISKKQQKSLSDLAEKLNKEKEELASKNRLLEDAENDRGREKEELQGKVAEQEALLSTLSSNKKELEQILIQKIKENEEIQRGIGDKLAEADRKIREAEQLHDSFFIDTIHEMRTPLSLVLGSLALVVQNKDPENDMSTQLLSAYRNTLAMQDLADQLIGTQRTNDVSSYLRVARYDMVEVARQSCDLFVDWVAMNNVKFRVNTQTNVLWVWFDRRKLEFALRMLLSNAFKNTFSYGKVIFNISVVRKDGKAFCSLAIKDEGLDEEKSARRGLKQVEDMASDIGGSYESESDSNGTVYTLLIPLGKQHLLDRRVEFVEPEADLVKLTEKQKEEIAEVIQVVPEQKGGNKKILVIDDSDQIRWFLKHVFNKEYNILEARNGQEGVEVALEEMPDLVLCDVMMPVKDGFDVCRELKNDPRTAQLPIVMLTAKVESEDVITGIEAGADDYITKPFDVEILQSKISSLMKKRDEMRHYFTANAADSSEKEGDSLPSRC